MYPSLRQTFFIAVTIVALVGCQASDDTIRIGFIGPLTGDAVSYGVDTLNATRLAIDEQNARGGIRGKKLSLIVEDGACNGSTAAEAAHKLIDIDHVTAILGGNCSNETLAAAPIAEANKTILLAAVSSSKDVTTAGEYIFRLWPSNAKAAPKVYAQFLRDHSYKNIAMLTENTIYCKSLQTTVRANIPSGTQVVFDEVVDAGTKDFRTLFTRLKNTNVDALYINLQGDSSIIPAVTQLRELGLKQDILLNDIGESATIGQQIPKQIDGAYVLSIASPEQSTDIGKEFVKKFNDNFGSAKQAPSFPAVAYDATRVLMKVMNDVGFEGDKMKEGLYAVKNFEGTVGTFSFDSAGDTIGIPYGVKQWKNGAIKQLSVVPLD